MASSFQIVGNRSIRFDDIDLLVMLHLMIRSAEAMHRKEPAELDLVDYWRHACEIYGPGTVDLRLGQLASDGLLRSFFLRVLDSVRRESETHGETYPARLLMKDWLTSGVAIYEYKTEHIRSTANDLRKLLEQ